MPTVLITGANRGLGLEFARQYQADGWDVIACCRKPAEATELNALGVRVEALDVADEASVAVLKGRIDVPIDLLLNNAGTYGARDAGRFGAVDAEEFLKVQRINALGPLLVTQALTSCLEKAAAERGEARVAVVSSKMGSIGENTSGGSYIYRASKASANAVVRSMAHDLRERGIVVIVLHPGWVRTDMGGPNGLIDPPESVSGMRSVIASTPPDRAGCFFNYDGKEIPW